MEVSDDESTNQDERMEEEPEPVVNIDGGQPNSESGPTNINPISDGVIAEEVPDTEEFLGQLHTTFEQDPGFGLAANHLKRYLSWAVPYCFKFRKELAPLDKHQPPDDSSPRAQSMLFPVLEGFLNKNNDLTRYMQGLAVARPSICGRVFKAGEPTYSCRDCGMDPTCVLCAACFKHSGHKDHRYRISTSGGGGYCDCGDEEAWKSDKYCSLHQPVVEVLSDDRQLKPLELHSRSHFLFGFFLDYSYRLLTCEQTLSVPPDLRLGIEVEETSKLPEHMKNFVKDDLYCTVLCNDETNTFDGVISTLQQTLGCQQKDAAAYATIVDREGRCVVKIGGFQQCYLVKQAIDEYSSRNGGKPLKVILMQSHVIAHQIFALKALEWIGSLLEKYGAYRDLFANRIEELKDESNRCMLEGVMLNDTKFWKAARSTWHHVLMAGMLKDYELKKKFAVLFSRNYADLIKEFIRDDHDHPFSITSLSVQMFTVPTIAHFLIEAHDVFFTIMRTLMSEWEQKVNSGTAMTIQVFLLGRFLTSRVDVVQDRKLEFDRGTAGFLLKRTNFVLVDLRYILTIPPTTWTDTLIKNFNRGMDCLFQLLCTMQEMDAVTRQTGDHLEYETEWESAFNLQIKLQPILSLSLEWLATNKLIFIRAFRYCLEELAKEYKTQTTKTASIKFADHEATSYIYDVSCEPISVHLPLSRFFAGLYMYLEQHGLEFASSEFEIPDKPVPEILIEPSLRTQVLLAQAHAGMWKRNGYSLLNQLYFYQNVRCRTEMMDKDIVALQMGAAHIEANEFLIHILNRFDLFQWADPLIYERYLSNSEDGPYKHFNTILSEFLGLVINIFSARYIPGVGQVTKEDCTRKEIIQLLCIEPMTHSSLSKGLVENVNGETGLEAVIQEIAMFRKASKAGHGFVYELKPELYVEYDWHHYHYTREEMSRAEEKQRERKKTAKEAEFFPPPTLPPFSGTFNLVVNILKSDVLLKMISLILQRSVKKTKTFSDSHLRKALHLIGLGLNEEIACNEKEHEHFFQFCEPCKRWRIFELLDGLLKEPHLVQHYEMILWIMKQKNKIRRLNDSEPVMQMEQEQLVQPSEEEEKRKIAAKTRAKILANMMASQQRFMAGNADLFATDDMDTPICNEKDVPVQAKTVALGPNQTPLRQDDESYICILCKDEHPLTANSKEFILAAFIQRSSVLCETRNELRAKEIDKSFDFLEKTDIWLKRNLLQTPHISSCGHIMHETCWASHVKTVINKELRRPYRLPQSFDVDMQEWLCPMCDCICNAALPMALPLHKLYQITSKLTEAYADSVLQAIVNWAETEGNEKGEEVNQVETKENEKAEPGPDITDIPLLMLQVPPATCALNKGDEEQSQQLSSSSADTTPSSQFELAERAKICLPPNTAECSVVSAPGEVQPPHSILSYRDWLRGMEIMNRVMNNNAGEYDSDNAPEVGEDQQIPDKVRFRNSLFPRNLLKHLYQWGLSAERLLEMFHCRICSEHKETTNWLHARFFDKLVIFMERVFAVASDQKKVDPEKVGYQLHRTLWHSLAYTIMSAEAYHRDQKISFFGDNVPTRRSLGLKFLTRVCSVSVDPQLFTTGSVLRSEFMLLLKVIWYGESQLPCMMELDAFGLLVLLTYLMPFALCHTYDDPTLSKNKTEDGSPPSVPGKMGIQPPVGSALDHHNLRIAFTIHVYQVVVALGNLAEYTFPHDDTCPCHMGSSHTGLDTEEVEATMKGAGSEELLRFLLFYLWAKPREALPMSNPGRAAFCQIKAHLDCDRLWAEVSNRTIPFLRCCAKLYESMTGISPPPALEKIESSFEDLANYLDVPKSFYELFECAEIAKLSTRWSRHPSMRVAVDPLASQSSNDPNLKYLSTLPLPRTLRPLVNLPMDYTDLINSASLIKCVKCDPHDSRMPTMCLLCGEILCSQSYCCQQELKNESIGACTYHAYFCGGGIGIFLRIRECRVFLLNRNKGCHMLPPYVDQYGETDQGLRRGNPMTLSKEKYDSIRRLWIQHAIPEEISRITENSHNLPITEWAYL